MLCKWSGREDYSALTLELLRHICLMAPAFFRPPDVPCQTSLLGGSNPNPKTQIQKNRHKGGFFVSGRDERIRTSDFLHPMQALYQAELRPD